MCESAGLKPGPTSGARATSASATTTANTGILHFVQDDDVKTKMIVVVVVAAAAAALAVAVAIAIAAET